MFNSNLNIISNLQTAFKILKIKELLDMPGNFKHNERKSLNTFYNYFIALSHQTKYHSKQSSGQRNTKL